MNQELINSIFRAMVQSQIYHWLTDSNHIHNVLGEFYESLQKQLDELAESYLVGNNLNGDYSIDINYNYDSNKIDNCLINCKEKLELALEKEQSETIKDGLLTILKTIEKTIYLLQMKG